MPQLRAHPILAIQVLRGVAALMVVMHHAQAEVAALAQRAGAVFAPSPMLPWAAGVDVFFVISGFIIVHAAAPLAAGPGLRRRFLAHRVARVVPLYWLVTGLYLAVALALPASVNGAGGSRDPGYVAAAFLFWPAARPDGTVQPLYGLGWTLNCEMAFYLLFALGLGWGRRVAAAWIVVALSAVVLAGAWARPAAVAPAFWSNPVMLEFALGAAVAFARGEGWRLSRTARAGLALGGVALLALAARVAPEPDGFLRPLLLGLPASCLVAAAALGRPAPEPQARAIPAALGALGDASYALYLIHPFVLRGLGTGLSRLDLTAGASRIAPWVVLGLMLAGSVAAALLLHRFVERPMTRYARARLDARPGAPARAKTV